MKKNNWLAVVLTIGTFFWIVFLFRNSLQPAIQSYQWSREVLDSLIALFPFLSVLSLNLLRKLAHCFEYTVLGILLSACPLRGPFRRRIVLVLSGALIPCIDELLQRFTTGRSSQLSDVFLDWISMLVGAGIVWLFRQRKTSRHSG